MITIMSVNAFNLYQHTGQTEPEKRYAQLEAMVRRVDPDIVALQELVAVEEPGGLGKRDVAARNLERFGAAVGRSWMVDDVPVLAVGGGIHHTALLWRPEPAPGRARIAPVAGTVARFERDPHGMWHSLVSCVFIIGDARIRVASVQLSPFDQSWGWRDAAQVMRAMNSDEIPGLVAGDWNGIGATTVTNYDGWNDYDPHVYSRWEWHPDHAYQLDENGRLDRRVARRLEGPGRMRDCARIACVRHTPTTGRHPADPHPPRRVDRIYASYHFPDQAVTGLSVVEADNLCSDHDPVVVSLDEAALCLSGAPCDTSPSSCRGDDLGYE